MWKTLHIWVNNYCTRNCPHCAHLVPSVTEMAYDISTEEIEVLSKTLCGIRRVVLTGGEPTAHPKFPGIIYAVTSMLKPEFFVLQTNGSGFKKWTAGLFSAFNEIQVTRYDGMDDKYVTEAADELRTRTNVIVGTPDHTQDQRTGRSNPCFRHGTQVYFRGSFYPCCPGPAIDDNPHIPIGDRWLDELKQLKPACHNCRFAT